MSAIICKPSDVLRGIVGQCWWYSAYQPPAPGECHADHPSSLAKMDLRMIRWFCSSFVMNMSTNMVPQDKLNTCFMLWHLATCWSDKLNSCPLQKPPTPCVHSVPLLLDRMMSCMVIQGKFWSLCALIAMGSFQNWFLFSGETGDPPWVFGDHPIFICCFFWTALFTAQDGAMCLQAWHGMIKGSWRRSVCSPLPVQISEPFTSFCSIIIIYY